MCIMEAVFNKESNCKLFYPKNGNEKVLVSISKWIYDGLLPAVCGSETESINGPSVHARRERFKLIPCVVNDLHFDVILVAIK